MKKVTFNFLLLLCGVLIATSSCKKDDQPKDMTQNIVGTYVGDLEVLSTLTAQTQYTITVEKVSNTEIKIVPSDNQASAWETSLIQPSSATITNADVSTNQITFDIAKTPVTISYNFNNGAEQFTGNKQ